MPGNGCDGEDGRCQGDFQCQNVSVVGPSCRGYRLPTEAEWQYAASGGMNYEYGTDDGTISNSNANYNKYVGEFKDNERNGQGTITWPNGKKTNGEYKNIGEAINNVVDKSKR